MPKENISQSRLIKSVRLIADQNIVWSSGKIWDGLIIEKHRFDKVNSSENKIPDHGLLIRFSAGEKKAGGAKFKDKNRLTNICFFSKDFSPQRFCEHHQHETIVLMLTPEVLKRAANEMRGNLSVDLAEQHLVIDAQIEHIGMALKTEAEDGYLSGRLYGESLGLALSVHLLSKYSINKSDFGEHKGGLTPGNLRRVVEYIQNNLTEDIGLSSLAKVANLSQFRFAHNFKQATGLAPHQYIIHKRMELAKKMLCETDLTVTTIAYAVGCGSPSRFTLLFRRANGVIPSVYRASFR